MNVLTTMKFEINSNKIFSYNGSNKEEIHPFWLRERVSEKEHLDEGTQQRLFDPSSMSHSIDILDCLLYTSPSPRDATLSRMPSSA